MIAKTLVQPQSASQVKLQNSSILTEADKFFGAYDSIVQASQNLEADTVGTQKISASFSDNVDSANYNKLILLGVGIVAAYFLLK